MFEQTPTQKRPRLTKLPLPEGGRKYQVDALRTSGPPGIFLGRELCQQHHKDGPFIKCGCSLPQKNWAGETPLSTKLYITVYVCAILQTPASA
jgi:hypothetical protein